ncbi:phosphoribosyl-ATP diphosphatase [Sphingomonas sp. Leaf25]|uniref:phosphoribosyl-ATP diphosphatase n=1 Tax=Sphingomonas sp. Leaf25 TaxID=1735692 RepID=UPI0006F37BC7|nr:phosphoribosyl-ATP diphosphatase [Sphingomonas sp. Leaf25]KQN07269.1 phosphoribosyl-ATP pyrophosphatase [Sphingomonas sp. Leaf25]
MDALDHLESVIAVRLHGDPAQSYVAKLHARGMPKIAQKVGEEAVECVIAAMADDRDGLIGEAADLLFHLLVLLAEKRITLDEVRAELTRRDGLSGIAEKAARPTE